MSPKWPIFTLIPHSPLTSQSLWSNLNPIWAACYTCGWCCLWCECWHQCALSSTCVRSSVCYCLGKMTMMTHLWRRAETVPSVCCITAHILPWTKCVYVFETVVQGNSHVRLNSVLRTSNMKDVEKLYVGVPCPSFATAGGQCLPLSSNIVYSDFTVND